jgi:hypothetical protein
VNLSDFSGNAAASAERKADELHAGRELGYTLFLIAPFEHIFPQSESWQTHPFQPWTGSVRS